MTDKEKLQQIGLYLEKFQWAEDEEHLEDIERNRVIRIMKGIKNE